MLQDKETRKLFIYLRPYMEDLVEAFNKDSQSYTQMIRYYKEFLSKNKN